MDEADQQYCGQQTSHDQWQPTCGQAGAARVVGGQGCEVADGDRCARLACLAEAGRHAPQGLGDRGAGGRGDDDLRAARAEVDGSVYLLFADKLLSRTGVGDFGDFEAAGRR